MTIRVLVVDDSGFFRRRVAEMLKSDPQLEVIGTASNGQEAIDQTLALRPDVVTMDIEMPVLDGIAATRRIMEKRPTPIIMFSSLTTDGARATLDALDAGAADFLPKRFEDISNDHAEVKRLLCERIRGLAHRPVQARSALPAAAQAKKTSPVNNKSVEPSVTAKPVATPKGDIRLVAIGTSTGGPVALQEVLTKLPANFPAPLLLIQHMPASFTPSFAQRLDSLCAINVKEAQDGDVLLPNHAYLAPGGKQMLVEKRGNDTLVRVIEAEPRQTYKPSVDVTFASIAKLFPRQTLAVVMTGMGADGREGARLLKQNGSRIWTQDEASCVVYGMPAAIKEAGLSDRELSLREIGPALSLLG
ncbi:MAG: chemotaxis response regulator protein-glutamate methylesterase [Gammaproteobacteria bacterium]|nr:chemotaxis response regulator protein-glutamate methylesterase [Gammaproteobacteria bacterium]